VDEIVQALIVEDHVKSIERRPRFAPRQSEIGRSKLEQLATCPQTGDRKTGHARLRTPREYDHRTAGRQSHQPSDGGEAVVAQEVDVVDDDDGLGATPGGLVQRSLDTNQQSFRAPILPFGPDPEDTPLLTRRPLLEQRRLSVASGGNHDRERAGGGSQPVDERGTPDEAILEGEVAVLG
jgi:hypothetical protein